ncbi:MAG: M20 family metallopeptidase [Gemmatimonadota bacterium]|jgi:hippurate hydrolase|nr:M20 family metallopeptidase [Gemmatimonadota bacterium]MDQ8167274.1 M20 family metallopeptidase [Gemmatimonadota bacterium]MDQ8172040.1 M20 family metallopeptidase [Gemmatimonadota bacterium]
MSAVNDPADVAGVPAAVLAQFSAAQRASLIALRRDLHAHPELSFAETRSCTVLERALAPASPVSVQRVAGTGLVARIRGLDPHAPVVAVRGDIDALPIHEATGLPYASQHPGVMHACGHDVHASWTVGAAYLLAQQPAAGDVLIVLQPAEEIGEGASAMLRSGALQGVAAIFGAHVDRRFPVGQVVAQAGPLAAAADSFTVVLRGRGAHGARPHESADPVLGAGLLIAALQGVVSRRVNPATPAVLTVATMQAGAAPNVIPDTASIGGTLRATDPITRALLARELQRVAEGIALAHDLTAEVRIELGPPPIVNPDQPAAWAREAALSLVGADGVVPLGITNMAGEDFAYYMESIPGAFMRIGAREADGKPTPAHTPQFFAADGSLFVGAAVLAQTARLASAALAGAT